MAWIYEYCWRAYCLSNSPYLYRRGKNHNNKKIATEEERFMINKTLLHTTHRVLALAAVTSAVVALVGIVLVFTTGSATAG